MMNGPGKKINQKKCALCSLEKISLEASELPKRSWMVN